MKVNYNDEVNSKQELHYLFTIYTYNNNDY